MKRPFEFYEDSWNIFRADKSDNYGYQKAIDAFKEAGDKHNVALSGCMTNKTSALSYMMDDVLRKIKQKEVADKKK